MGREKLQIMTNSMAICRGRTKGLNITVLRVIVVSSNFTRSGEIPAPHFYDSLHHASALTCRHELGPCSLIFCIQTEVGSMQANTHICEGK